MNRLPFTPVFLRDRYSWERYLSGVVPLFSSLIKGFSIWARSFKGLVSSFFICSFGVCSLRNDSSACLQEIGDPALYNFVEFGIPDCHCWSSKTGTETLSIRIDEPFRFSDVDVEGRVHGPARAVSVLSFGLPSSFLRVLSSGRSPLRNGTGGWDKTVCSWVWFQSPLSLNQWILRTAGYKRPLPLEVHRVEIFWSLSSIPGWCSGAAKGNGKRCSSLF